jgi:hypothetical protein
LKIYFNIIRKRLVHMFRNIILFHCEYLLTTRPTSSWRTTLCRLSTTAYSMYSQLLYITGGRTSICNQRTRHAVVIGTHLTRVLYVYILKIVRYFLFNIPSAKTDQQSRTPVFTFSPSRTLTSPDRHWNFCRSEAHERLLEMETSLCYCDYFVSSDEIFLSLYRCYSNSKLCTHIQDFGYRVFINITPVHSISQAKCFTLRYTNKAYSLQVACIVLHYIHPAEARFKQMFYIRSLRIFCYNEQYYVKNWQAMLLRRIRITNVAMEKLPVVYRIVSAYLSSHLSFVAWKLHLFSSAYIVICDLSDSIILFYVIS